MDAKPYPIRGLVRRVWRQLSPQARRLYFVSVIQPCLDYCAAVTCTQFSQRSKKTLLSLFRRGIRAVCGATPDTEITPLLKFLNLGPLEVRWIQQLFVFAYRSLSPKSASAPLCVRDNFVIVSQTRQTRGQVSGLAVVPRRTTSCGRNCFDNRLVLLWNSLPAEIRASPNLAAFKRGLISLFADSTRLASFSKIAFCLPSDL